MNLAGRAIVVTGGAGHIGGAICQGLSAAGARVMCVSSKRPEPRTPHYAICDCDDEDEVHGFLAEYGDPIHGLVHCAGRAPRHADLSEAFDLDTTAGTAFRCIRTVAAHMREGGSIVTVASMWGLVSPTPAIYAGMTNDPSYTGVAGAGAVLALTRYLAVRLAPIRVNALVPGWFPKRNGPDNPDYMRAIESRVPLGRIGKPDELVGPALFLLSDASSYMTGQHLIIDGGYTLQ